MEGAFHCTCTEGMLLDSSNRRCLDLNECKTPGYCENGKCQNKPDGNGFTCDCNRGYIKTLDGITCEGKQICDYIMQGLNYSPVPTYMGGGGGGGGKFLFFN